MELEINEKNKITYTKEKNLLLRKSYEKNQKDFSKREELREQRLQQINSYRDEQIAALKY